MIFRKSGREAVREGEQSVAYHSLSPQKQPCKVGTSHLTDKD